MIKLDDAILIALIGAAVTILGWFMISYLSRSKEDRTRKIDKNKANKDLIINVLSACNTRAVYTRTHAQLDHKAMFQSLTKSRLTLQDAASRIESKNDQQLVVNIVGQIDFIERNKKDFDKIDQAKLKIIALLKKLSDSAGVPYVLPQSITEELFFSLEEADQPPTD